MGETKPKEVVGRNVVIALGIVCIILIVGLGAAVVRYTAIINNKDTIYDNLSGNYVEYVTTHIHADSDYNNYVEDHHHTDEDYANINSIANLAVSTVWINDQTVSQPANSYTNWTFSTSYAGYVAVWVQSSNVSGTNVSVAYYTSHVPFGQSFDQSAIVGAASYANFPILPSSNVTIKVGNGNLVNGATETITITYYY